MGNDIRRKFYRESQIAADLPGSTVSTSDEDDEESEAEIPAKDPNLKIPNTDRNDTEESDNDDYYDEDDDDDEG
jgi:hypothetical protein